MISVFAVVRHLVTTFLDSCKRENVGNPVRVIPYSTISRQLAYETGGRDTSVAVNIHERFGLSNITQEFGVVEHINRGLVVQQDPCVGHGRSSIGLKHGFVGVSEKLEPVGDVIVEFAFGDTRKEEGCAGLTWYRRGAPII
jgi:hypothetical protein